MKKKNESGKKLPKSRKKNASRHIRQRISKVGKSSPGRKKKSVLVGKNKSKVQKDSHRTRTRPVKSKKKLLIVSRLSKGHKKVIGERGTKKVRQGFDRAKPVKTLGKASRETVSSVPYTVTGKRGSNAIVYNLKGRSINRNLNAIEQTTPQRLSYLMKKNDKPPQAVVIKILSKEEGKHKTILSPPDFVVNEKNVKAFIKGIINRIDEDWSDFQDNDEEGDGSENYELFDPDTINQISIKFIY